LLRSSLTAFAAVLASPVFPEPAAPLSPTRTALQPRLTPPQPRRRLRRRLPRAPARAL